MRTPEIESWVLALVDRVEAKQPIEDSRVELKAAWPEPPKAARRLAGHANAARGDAILWVIGLDEERGVVGADAVEVSSWWQQARRCFEELAPEAVVVNVPVAGKTLVALFVETDRAPYVVKNPEGGAIQYEVPWREGTAVRSARRADLLRMLAPQIRLPRVELLSAILTVTTTAPKGADVHVRLGLYVVPRTRDRVVMPFHHSRVELRTLEGHDLLEPPGTIGIADLLVPPGGAAKLVVDGGPTHTGSETIAGTETELIVEGPGLVVLNAHGRANPEPLAAHETVRGIVHLQPTDTDDAVVLDAVLVRNKQEKTPVWILAEGGR